MRPSRRELLAAMGLLGAGAAVGCVDGGLVSGDDRTGDPDSDWEGLGEADDALFPMGVQSGDPLPDGVVLWTRYDGAAPVVVEVAHWTGQAWEAEPSIAVEVVDRFVHFDLRGRSADEPLAFQFVDTDGKRSRVGHTRTAMRAGARGLLRVGATSCAHQSHVDFPSLPAAMGRGPLDFWAWLGDTAYFDGASTREQYDALWRSNLSTAGFRSVLAATASVYTWDDHEVGNNWTHDPEFPPERIATAYDAFFANTPLRRHPTVARRIWRGLRFGRTAEVFVLDSRGERDEPNGIYVSEEQLQWLVDGITRSPCAWKLVLNSVPFADLPAPYDVDVSLNDRWEGYPEQRQALLEAAAAQRGVLFLSGDVHHPALVRGAPEGLGSNLFDFLCGPAGFIPNPLGELLRGSPGYLWGRSVYSSARLELSPFGLARLQVIGEEDQTWMEALIDDKGALLSLEEIDPEG